MTRLSLVIILACCLGACAEVERSAGMAFGNANSVVRSPSDTLWSKDSAKPQPSPTSEDAEKRSR